MDMFLLEDEEYDKMFITQSDNVLNGGANLSNNHGNDGNIEAENSGSSSLGNVIEAIYSDISDDEFYIFSSQLQPRHSR